MRQGLVGRRALVGAAIALILLPAGVLAMLSFTSSKPKNLGVHDGRLAACPDRPNCVSSQSTDPRHQVEPLAFTGSSAAAVDRLRRVLADQPRTVIQYDDGRYVHAEFRSRLFRFVDDVEFFVADAERVIHVRSASRVGRSDLGVNRRRVEAIRAAFAREAN